MASYYFNSDDTVYFTFCHTFVFSTTLFALVCLTCLILLNYICSVTVGVLPYSTLYL